MEALFLEEHQENDSLEASAMGLPGPTGVMGVGGHVDAHTDATGAARKSRRRACASVLCGVRLEDIWFGRSVIRSVAKLTYDDALEFIQSTSNSARNYFVPSADLIQRIPSYKKNSSILNKIVVSIQKISNVCILSHSHASPNLFSSE